MIRDVAIDLLNLIKENTGIVKQQIHENQNIDIQKIIDIILSETRCSITDEQGNYSRFGSSTDIRIIRELINIFISDTKEIPPEIVCMALRKEETFGPFLNIIFDKKYNKQTKLYDLEMERIFPNDFYTSIFENNEEVRELFVKKVLKPYAKEVIFENDILMSKSKLGAFISKLFTTPKENEKLVKDLIKILKLELKSDDKLIENIANYIIINIMSNKYFKTELVNTTLDATELQRLGKVYYGFNSLVDSMVSQTFRMIELKSFPYGEYIAIKNTFHTTIAVLESLATSFENLDEHEILEKMQFINSLFAKTDSGKKADNNSFYRTKELNTNKFGDIVQFVECEKIKECMDNLCKMIKVLLKNKDNITPESYIKEVIRIEYRYLRIHPFAKANGRTARAIVNILLQSKGLLGIFKKENREEYLEWVREAHRIVKENEEKYVSALAKNPMECVDIENEFLDRNVPFLLAKN